MAVGCEGDRWKKAHEDKVADKKKRNAEKNEEEDLSRSNES